MAGGGKVVGRFLMPAYSMNSSLGLLRDASRGKPLLPRFIAFPPLRLTSARAIGSGFAELRCRSLSEQIAELASLTRTLAVPFFRPGAAFESSPSQP